MLVLHDDAEREYAYGPAKGLPNTKVGTLTQATYDEAKNDHRCHYTFCSAREIRDSGHRPCGRGRGHNCDVALDRTRRSPRAQKTAAASCTTWSRVLWD
jgi:hypothetical protein